MLRFALLLTAALLASCTAPDPAADDDDSADATPPEPEPTAVDEACADVADPGDATATDGEIAGLVRLNCYRRLLGLGEVPMDPALNTAARNHANYIEANDAYGHQETDPAGEHFTGEWVGDRVAAAGFVYDAIDTSIEEVVSVSTLGADAAFAVDLWVDSVYHRVPLLRPALDAVGVGQAGDFDVFVVASPWEPPGALQRTSLPVDGQFGVPPAFDSDRESPDPSALGVVGYPVSVSVQGPWTGPFEDPHGLRLDPTASSITGPDGPVGFAVLDPSNDPILREDAFLLPDAALAPDASYEVVLSGVVGGADFEIRATFETGP